MLQGHALKSRNICDTTYVAGEPGCPWSEEDMLKVRAKIHAVIGHGEDVYKELDNKKRIKKFNTVSPNAAKLLRLGFHDCLKYIDGTGGCDGCLEWEGVGFQYKKEDLFIGKFKANTVGDGHNNGLGPTVEVLEAIYTDPDFPSRTPHLKKSLRETGKSRADLWAFAALVAVEYSADLNNRVCDDGKDFQQIPYRQCHPRDGEEDCKVELPRPFVFKTGRKDCADAYRALKQEIHPDPQANGPSTVTYFKNNFMFNGRETVAILGGHTLGKYHVLLSLFRYTWKTGSELLFNNGYYRNLALERDWFYPSNARNGCKRVGNHKGERPIARWVPHVRGDTETGGPVQWLQEKLVCPTYNKNALAAVEKCKSGTEVWKFVSGLDEAALSCEIGLYMHFDVDSNGIPTKCSGLENFNLKNWGRDEDGKLANYRLTWSRINGTKAQPDCPLQNFKDPSDDKPLHEIVQDFADSSASWLAVFVPTLEKMLENGYTPEELTEAPAGGMAGFSCPFQRSDSSWSESDYTCIASSSA